MASLLFVATSISTALEAKIFDVVSHDGRLSVAVSVDETLSLSLSLAGELVASKIDIGMVFYDGVALGDMGAVLSESRRSVS